MSVAVEDVLNVQGFPSFCRAFIIISWGDLQPPEWTPGPDLFLFVQAVARMHDWASFSDVRFDLSLRSQAG